MSLIRVQGLKKSFGILDLFADVNFTVKSGERVGFVGANGAGKTTLMRCLLGQEETDGGTVGFDSAATIGYVEQQAELTGATLYDEFMTAFDDITALARKKQAMEQAIAAGDKSALEDYGRLVDRFEHLEGYDFEARIKKVAFGLGFTEEELQRETAHLSGGQRTRVVLAKALLREPDFLFLDEPTNHLDISMIEWLEEFLNAYTGGVLLISHDRYFLDKVATKIIDLDNKQITVYEGNYSYFAKVKADRRAALESAYAKQQEHIKKTEEYIRRFRAGIKSKQARGRQSQLNRLERIVLPPEAAKFNYFAFNPPAECADRVAELEEVSAVFGEQHIFDKLSLLVRRGDGVAIVGPNGAGKTTMLRLILGELNSPTGRIKIGNRVKTGYFSQHHEDLHMERSALAEIQYEFDLDEEQARGCLGAFLFHGDEVLRRIGDMSGGEQARLAFLKLMLTGANFLVLDEPTNHLDIPAKEAVEEALMAFPGTFIVVSHDRYFLDRVANFTVELEAGVLTEYEGDYSYYKEKKALLAKEAAEEAAYLASQKPIKAEPEPEKKVAVSREHEAAKRNQFDALSDNKKQELLQRTEAEIAMYEAELKMLEHEMNDPAIQSDPAKSAQIAADYAAKEQELAAAYEKWEQLAE